MNPAISSNDDVVLDLLRRRGALGIAELSEALEVTATAIRQRLTRVVERGLVERERVPAGRGRPSYRYRLSDKGFRHAGNNFAELAMALWQEVRRIPNLEVRRGLLQRLAERMNAGMSEAVVGETVGERMASLAATLEARGVAADVQTTSGLPVLSVLACPYPGLAEQDRSVCALERMLFAELLNHDVKLAECRLDGDACCRFELSGAATPAPAAS